jgi:hypothetical protein
MPGNRPQPFFAALIMMALSACNQSTPQKSSPTALAAGGAKATDQKLPEFLTPPPGTKIVEQIADDSGQGLGTVTMLESSQSPETVIAYYRQRLTAADYRFNDDFSANAKVPGRTTLYAHKNGADSVNVVASVDQGTTQIALSIFK